MPGTLFVVATPIGNLEDITLRALRILRDATVIAAEDTRRTSHLLTRHGITTPTTSLHEHNESRKTASLIERLHGGDHIALVSDAGTPTISDPGTGLIQAAIAAGITVEPVPGPNAAIAILSVCGLSTNSFAFLGFPPTRPKDRKSWFHRVKSIGGVIVFYEAPHRIHRTLEEFLAVVGDRPAVVGRELTKVHEQLVRGPISEVLTRLSAARGEYSVVIDVGEPVASAMVFGQQPEIDPQRRRDAVRVLARQLGVPPNELYKALERLK